MKKIILIIGLVIISLILIATITIFLSYKRITIVSNGKAIPQYNDPQTALLVIDVQRNLTTKSGSWILNLEQTDAMIEEINNLIENSNDKKYSVIYISNEFKKYSIINLMTNKAMEEGSEGAKIDKRIKFINNYHFIKSKMDTFTNKDFENFLQKQEINHLIISGIDAEDCVDKTIKGALNRNYQVTVISDAIATKSEKKRKQKIEDFRILGAEILSTEQFLNQRRK